MSASRFITATMLLLASSTPYPGIFLALPAGGALHAAPAQSATLEGTISIVDAGGKKSAQLTTADGRAFLIVGKLDKMIRDRYNGKSIKLSGKIEQDSAPGKPGTFRAEEIAVQLN